MMLINQFTDFPAGWKYAGHGYITPIRGPHSNTPMTQDSALAKVLGWPGPCNNVIQPVLEPFQTAVEPLKVLSLRLK